MKIEIALTDVSPRLANGNGKGRGKDRAAIVALFAAGRVGDYVIMVPSADSRSKTVQAWYATLNGKVYASKKAYRTGQDAVGNVVWSRDASLKHAVVTRDKLGDAFDTIPPRLLIKVGSGEDFSFVAPVAILKRTK
jgi:hypothetical protein